MSLAETKTFDGLDVTDPELTGEALYNLGIQYSTGQGVDLDYIEAHKYFNLAALKGNDEARSWRSQLAEEMTPAQVAEAQRQARAWLQNRPE
ncbi:MAG: SEL1-like repeat protein [Pseudomonadota bacterium]